MSVIGPSLSHVICKLFFCPHIEIVFKFLKANKKNAHNNSSFVPYKITQLCNKNIRFWHLQPLICKKKFYENVDNYWQNRWIYRNLENRHQTTLSFIITVEYICPCNNLHWKYHKKRIMSVSLTSCLFTGYM